MRISDWSSDVCSSDLPGQPAQTGFGVRHDGRERLIHFMRYRTCKFPEHRDTCGVAEIGLELAQLRLHAEPVGHIFKAEDRKSTRLNSITNAHLVCRLLLEKKKKSATTYT